MILGLSAVLLTLILGLASLSNRKIWIAILTVAAAGLQVVQIAKDRIDTKTQIHISDTNRDKIIEEVLKARVQFKRIAEMIPETQSMSRSVKASPATEEKSSK